MCRNITALFLLAPVTFYSKCQPSCIDLKEISCLSRGNWVNSETVFTFKAVHYISQRQCCVCMCAFSMQNVLPSLALNPEEDNVEEVTVQEKEKMINISYELAAEASKRSKLVAGNSPEGWGFDQKETADYTKSWCEPLWKEHYFSLRFIELELLSSWMPSVICHCSLSSFFIFFVAVKSLAANEILFCPFLCVCLVCVQHVALFHCSEKPVALFPTPSTVS